MNQFKPNKTYTTSEYFLSEEAGDVRHEFINGNLIKVPDEPREHHFICQNLLEALEALFSNNAYEIYIGSMKVKIPNEDQYYYPDIFITKEVETDENRFVQFQPELIIEVLSETTRTKDMVDKFIQYR